MDREQFKKELAAAPAKFVERFRSAVKYPHANNSGYLMGYLSALEEHKLMSHDSYHYWLSLVGRFYESQVIKQRVTDFLKEPLNES
jgi:hypothetical protein